MRSQPRFTAQIDLSDMVNGWHRGGPGKTGIGLLLAAIGLVTLLVLAWAVFIRKPKDENPRHYGQGHLKKRRKSDSAGATGAPGNAPAARASDSRSRRRRRRRAHRPRNPTLAETGGLPPVRPDVPSDNPP